MLLGWIVFKTFVFWHFFRPDRFFFLNAYFARSILSIFLTNTRNVKLKTIPILFLTKNAIAFRWYEKLYSKPISNDSTLVRCNTYMDIVSLTVRKTRSRPLVLPRIRHWRYIKYNKHVFYSRTICGTALLVEYLQSENICVKGILLLDTFLNTFLFYKCSHDTLNTFFFFCYLIVISYFDCKQTILKNLFLIKNK